MMSLPTSYKRAAFKGQGENLTIEEVPLKKPGRGEILVKVQACGVCHTDVFSQYNAMGGGFPLVPGHEIIGIVAAIGPDVTSGNWKVGDRIGGGYHGGHDNTCAQCLEGWPQLCDNPIANGIHKDGGFAEYCILNANAAVPIPADGDVALFAPLLCAGSTVFNALRHSGVQPGETVAVQGLGGLGHLAIQFARRMGFRVVAVSRGADKEAAARKLGAHEYIDSNAGDAGLALKALGGAKLALTTALSAEATTVLIKGLNIMGKLLVISIPGDITISHAEMIQRGISVQAWPVGQASDSEKTIAFAHLHDVRCAIETFPLDKAQDAYDAMLSGKVRFRAVITME